MAKPDLSAERPGGTQAQPEPRAQTRHAAGAGGQAAKLKDMQTALNGTLLHSPVVLEEQAQRAHDVQLRIADWITAFAGSMRSSTSTSRCSLSGCCSSSPSRGRR